jgi:glycosyltransferase involved in cell wall biosynthesis
MDLDLYEELRQTENILFVGRISQHKNQLDLIRALPLIHKRLGRNPHLYLVGGVFDETYFKVLRAQVSELALDEFVSFTGKVSQKQLISYYKSAQLFLSGSLHEGFGIPLIEAMANRVPVAAFEGGNIEDTVGKGGIIVKHRTPGALAAASTVILNDPTVRRYLKKEGRTNLERFSKSNIRKSIEEFMISFGAPELISKKICEDEVLPVRERWRIEGPITGNYSLSLVNREIVRGLKKADIDVYWRDFQDPDGLNFDQKFISEHNDLVSLKGTSSKASVVLRNSYPPIVEFKEDQETGDTINGEINGLACFAWEESGFPQRYVESFNRRLDLITTTSEHVTNLLVSNGVTVPVITIGNGVDHILKNRHNHNPIIKEGKFKFLHVSSGLPRKGIDVLLKAWSKAFSSESNVELLIKVAPNPHLDVEVLVKDHLNEFRNSAQVCVIQKDLPDEDVVSLLSDCDSLVQPSRCEGFCLPLAEAMLFEKAVITTNFGGQTDFCTDATAWLVDFDYEWSRSHLNIPYSVWAEPKIDDLARQMQAVYSSGPEERAKKGKSGRELVERRYTWRHVLQRLSESVSYISNNINLHNLPNISWVTTWNERCGIATYSQSLSRGIPEGLLNICASKAGNLVDADSSNVTRCWQQGWQDPLLELEATLDSQNADFVVIQYNFGLMKLSYLARLIYGQINQGRKVVLFLHSTADVDKDNFSCSLVEIKDALEKTNLIFVHGVNDLNRLKSMGLVRNVSIFPHGLPNTRKKEELGSWLNGPNSKVITIATFGFLLPHKGVMELIGAFDILRKTHSRLRLLLLNALYDNEESSFYYRRCLEKISASKYKNDITLDCSFLPEGEAIDRLAEADLIVYPYQTTNESASGAVRLGLATGKPVACSPLGIFDDIRSVIHLLPGGTPKDIADGIETIISAPAPSKEEAAKLLQWRQAVSWDQLSKRFWRILRAEHGKGSSPYS